MSKEDDYDLLIVNGLVVTAEEAIEADVAIKNEKIAAVKPRGSFKDAKAKRTIDAQGAWVTPGGVDAHVHLEEPPLFGMEHVSKTCLAWNCRLTSESRQGLQC